MTRTTFLFIYYFCENSNVFGTNQGFATVLLRWCQSFFGGFVCCRRGASTLLSSSDAATATRRIKMKVLGLLFV